MNNIASDLALSLLIEGNKRFIKGKLEQKKLIERREELVKGQHPFAIVLTCSDSRTPPELIFDQGLGDIFVVRTAGNIIDDISMGSIEYAADHLECPIIIVLGHDYCGAVKATIEGGEVPGKIGEIAKKIMPSVEKVKAKGLTGKALNNEVEDENIIAVVAEIKESSVIKHLEERGKLVVRGAKYFLDSGKVEFR